MLHPPKTGPSIRISNASRPGVWAQRTIEVKASHVSLISQPDVITALMLEAAGQA
jgi:hypothetical protein